MQLTNSCYPVYIFQYNWLFFSSPVEKHFHRCGNAYSWHEEFWSLQETEKLFPHTEKLVFNYFRTWGNWFFKLFLGTRKQILHLGKKLVVVGAVSSSAELISLHLDSFFPVPGKKLFFQPLYFPVRGNSNHLHFLVHRIFEHASQKYFPCARK